jgi:hypothetical protein
MREPSKLTGVASGLSIIQGSLGIPIRAFFLPPLQSHLRQPLVSDSADPCSSDDLSPGMRAALEHGLVEHSQEFGLGTMNACEK